MTNKQNTTIVKHLWFKKLIHAIYLPLVITLLATGSYIAYRYYYFPLHQNHYSSEMIMAASVILQATIFVSIYWFFSRLVDNITHYLLTTTLFTHHKRVAILFPFFKSLVKAITLLALFNLIVPYLGLPSGFELFLEKISSVLIICAIAWLLLRLTHVSEQLVLKVYFSENAQNRTNRLYTQMLILKRISIGIILILALGSILMLFENVRTLGTSVLTTAGIVSLLLTLTAQRSLPSILASVEIAVAQPIKIGDSVIVENQFGVVEKINFRYVIIKLWDWRRLVLPTTYFLEKPFENWSVDDTANLIGTVFLYVDYTMPLEKLRQYYTKILNESELWDGKVNTIQVSNCTEQTMELRILASASSPANTWNLRCEIREKLIAFISTYYPTCLPIGRTIQYPAKSHGHFSEKHSKNESTTVI